MSIYAKVETQRVTAASGVEYAYRSLGVDTGTVPLVMLQHFRGNLDYWDPALIDRLAEGRRVITFDNVGVGATTGQTPHTIAAMAEGAADFAAALELDRVDLLGFSIGSFVAQELALQRPDLVNRIVLASASPQGAAGTHGWAPDIIADVGAKEVSPESYVRVFFTDTPTGLEAAGAATSRTFGARVDGHDTPASWDTRLAQYDAVTRWGIPNHALLERLHGITQPVFVANGDSDRMIPPRYSYLLAGLLPDAAVKIYPDSAHGFLFQHHEEFASDVAAFLGR